MLTVHEGIEDAQNDCPTRPQARQTPEAADFHPPDPELPRQLFPKRGTLRMLSSRERRLRKGASLGKEAVLADSGREGEVAAGAGRVRSLPFSASQ